VPQGYLVQYAANVPVTLPADEWVESGQAATGTFPAEEVSGDIKYVYVSDDRPDTITAPTTITATYDTYYEVTYASSPAGLTVPADEWVLSGQLATGVFATPQYNGANTIKYDFVSDDDPGAINAPTLITGTYSTSYKMTFKQTGSPIAPTVTYYIDSGGDVTDTVEFFVWVLSGETITYSYQNPVPNGLYQYWLSSVTPTSPATISSPTTVTGNYLKLPYSAVTSSSLCPLTNDQFKLLFIQDMKDPLTYRLTASNPGQFYYNVFYVGTPGETVDLTITIPAPFVTQGAMPVHVYSSVSYSGSCFVPSGELAAYPMIITGLSGDTLELTDFEIPSSGLVYVTVHLDFGYKNKDTPSFTPDGGLNAYIGTTKTIPNKNPYTFSYTDGGTHPATVSNVNEFKKIPGFGGVVTDGSNNPLSGVTVTVKVNGVTSTTTTNADGFYLINYKTGKTQSYTISANGYTSRSGTINANKFIVNNFP
jgi:hypothetical protein